MAMLWDITAARWQSSAIKTARMNLGLELTDSMRPLAAVRRILERGNKVHFHEIGGWIRNVAKAQISHSSTRVAAIYSLTRRVSTSKRKRPKGWGRIGVRPDWGGRRGGEMVRRRPGADVGAPTGQAVSGGEAPT